MKRLAWVMLLIFLVGCTSRPSPPPAPPIPVPSPAPQPGPKPIVTAPTLAHLQMVDTATGWGWSEQGLFRTADGGRTWTDVTPVGQAMTDRSSFQALDGQTAWVTVSTVIYRTADGGKSWESSGLQGDFIRDISFQDEQKGWVQVSNNAATGGTELVSLYRTADGGATWTLTAANQVGDNAMRNFPHAGMKTGITFLDDQMGFATGYLTNVSQLFFFATRDGGQTWQQQDLTLPDMMAVPGPESQGTPSAFPPLIAGDGALVLKVSSPHCKYGQPCSVVFISTDQGKTWQASAPIVPSIADYDFVDATHGWVAVNGAIQMTTDGGQTWTTASLELATAVDFLDTTTGFAVAQGGLFRTEDGGRTWKPVN